MVNKMDSKVLHLGRKLLALAKDGVGGEKETAQRMLDSFLEKHNLTITDIEPAIRTRRIVKGVNNEIRQMFYNFTASIVGRDFQINNCKGIGYYAVYMNDEEWDTFNQQWPVYRKSLRNEILKKKRQMWKEIEKLTAAFIHKHHMFPPDAESSDRKLTPEELQEILDILAMSEKLDDINFYKQLGK